MMNSRTSALALVMAGAVLGGCAAREDDLQKIQASGAKPPPGYHAHLGLLYGQQGKLDQFVQHIEIEKKQFPESETYMNFLLRNFKKPNVGKAL